MREDGLQHRARRLRLSASLPTAPIIAVSTRAQSSTGMTFVFPFVIVTIAIG